MVMETLETVVLEVTVAMLAVKSTSIRKVMWDCVIPAVERLLMNRHAILWSIGANSVP